jgi:hypothetical protein
LNKILKIVILTTFYLFIFLYLICFGEIGVRFKKFREQPRHENPNQRFLNFVPTASQQLPG